MITEKEWEAKKSSCEHYSGSFWKGFEYCWHDGWKEELIAIGKKPDSVCRWCDYCWCPLKGKMKGDHGNEKLYSFGS